MVTCVQQEGWNQRNHHQLKFRTLNIQKLNQLWWRNGNKKKQGEIGEMDGSGQTHAFPVSLHLWLVCISFLPLFILSFHLAVWLETSDTSCPSNRDDLMRANAPTEFSANKPHVPLICLTGSSFRTKELNAEGKTTAVSNRFFSFFFYCQLQQEVDRLCL